MLPEIQRLVDLAKAGELDQYMETLEALKVQRPAAFARFAEIADFENVGDALWMIYNAQGGDGDRVDEVNCLLASLAEIA